MSTTRISTVSLFLLTILPAAALSQTLNWMARFDDVRAGNETTQRAFRAPSGGFLVFAERNASDVLLTISSDGILERETAIPSTAARFATTLTSGSDGTLYAAETGRTDDGNQLTFRLWRYHSQTDQWTLSEYALPGVSWGAVHRVAVDALGNAVIAGPASAEYSGPFYLQTVSFDAQGQFRWANLYDAVAISGSTRTGNTTAQIDADNDGGFSVAASRSSQLGGLLMLKYRADGTLAWENQYSENPNHPTSVPLGALRCALDATYVAAFPGGSLLAMKLDKAGQIVWQDRTLALGGLAPSIAYSPYDGAIYIKSARFVDGNEWDLALVRYESNGTKTFAWTFDSGPGYSNQRAVVACDSLGRAYLYRAIDINGAGPESVRLMQIMPDGTIPWERRYAPPGRQVAKNLGSLVLDPKGQPTIVTSIEDPHTSSDILIFYTDEAGGAGPEYQINTMIPSHEAYAYGVLSTVDGETYVLGDSEQYRDSGGLVLIKYGVDGQERWRRRVTEPDSRGIRMAFDPQQNIVIVGSIRDQRYSESGDIIALLYATDGRELWRTIYEGPTGQRDYPITMAVGSSRLFVTGVTVVGDQGLTLLLGIDLHTGQLLWDQLAVNGLLHAVADQFDNVYLPGSGFGITKYDRNGQTVWSRAAVRDGACGSTAYTIALTPSGEIIQAGKDCTASNGYQMAVLKFDSSGHLLWEANPPGPASAGIATHIALDAAGAVLIAGTGRLSAGSQGPYDLFVSEISPAGEIRWSASPGFRANAYASPCGIRADSDWVYVGGSYARMYGDDDACVLRYDRAGQLRWSARYDDAVMQRAMAQSFAQDGNGRTYLAGRIDNVSAPGDLFTLCYEAAPPPCPNVAACNFADTNADCIVDLQDLTDVLTNFGANERTTIAPLNGDVNFDRATDIQDLAIVLSAFEAACD